MQADVRMLKRGVAKLSKREFDDFVVWLQRLDSRRDYEALNDHTKGIAPHDVLKKFKAMHPDLGRTLRVLGAGAAGTIMAGFYERIRVRGCSFKADADMLLAEWGPESNQTFGLAYTRQVIPPRPDGEEQIWQLTLDMRFPMSDTLRRLKKGNRWFQSLRQLDSFRRFFQVNGEVGAAVHEMKPSDFSVSYQNVE